VRAPEVGSDQLQLTRSRGQAVVVSFAGCRWTVAVGEAVSFGRGRAAAIRLPDDDHLSRRAGSLQVLPDCVLVRNDSASKPLVLRPPVGEDRIVEPGAAVASLPLPEFSVVLAGRGGTDVVLTVDARQLTPPPSSDSEEVAPASETVTAPIELTAAQRRILVALCAPLLTGSGPRVAPATYHQIGAQLGRSPAYVRNVVKGLRESLAGHGVPGLTADDPGGAQEDYRWALARWAVRSGWVHAD